MFLWLHIAADDLRVGARGLGLADARLNRPYSEPPASRPRQASLFDRRADQVAPLGPRAVIVLDVAEAEQMLHHEPGEARSLADAAVRNHRPVAGDALRRIHRLQIVEALERAVVVAVLPPRNALRAGDVAAALAGFRQPGR